MADLKEMIGSRMTDTPSGWGTMFGEALGGATAQLTAGLKKEAGERGMINSRIELANNIDWKEPATGKSISDIIKDYTPENDDVYKENWLRKNIKKVMKTSPDYTENQINDILRQRPTAPKPFDELLLKSGTDWQDDYQDDVIKKHKELFKKLSEILPTFRELREITPLITKRKQMELNAEQKEQERKLKQADITQKKDVDLQGDIARLDKILSGTEGLMLKAMNIDKYNELVWEAEQSKATLYKRDKRKYEKYSIFAGRELKKEKTGLPPGYKPGK